MILLHSRYIHLVKTTATVCIVKRSEYGNFNLILNLSQHYINATLQFSRAERPKEFLHTFFFTYSMCSFQEITNLCLSSEV